MSFKGGKWLGGFRIQRTVEVAPPLRLREGVPEVRAAAVGSGVVSRVTFAFLTVLVDGGVSILLLLLLRAEDMSWMDGLHMHNEQSKETRMMVVLMVERKVVRDFPYPV